MKLPELRPMPMQRSASFWVMDDQVHMLMRSAEWYDLPPIERYLFNMCALSIDLAGDGMTERRIYSLQRYEHMRMLFERCNAQEWECAFEAYTTYAAADQHFGVVHLDKDRKRRGELLIGDDPIDYSEFCPDEECVAIFDQRHGGRGVEGSNA